MVRRYACHGWDIRYGQMKPEDDGDWVSYGDYEFLESQMSEKDQEIERLKSHIAKISDPKFLEECIEKVGMVDKIYKTLYEDLTYYLKFK